MQGKQRNIGFFQIQRKRIIRNSVRLDHGGIGRCNKIRFCFVIISLVIKNQNTDWCSVIVVILIPVYLCDHRLCKLCFAGSHCSYNSDIIVQDTFRIIRHKKDRFTVLRAMSEQYFHFSRLKVFV